MDNEKYLFIGGCRGGGKIFHLEQRLSSMHKELKKAKEEIERLNKELDEVKTDRDRWRVAAEWLMVKRKMEIR